MGLQIKNENSSDSQVTYSEIIESNCSSFYEQTSSRDEVSLFFGGRLSLRNLY